MSDRSFGEFIGGGLFWTAVIMGVRGFFGLIFSGAFWTLFVISMIVGGIITIFDDGINHGPVNPEQVEIQGYGTLDYASVVVHNNSEYEIKYVDATCGGKDFWITHIPANSSKSYETYAGNIPRGSLSCVINNVNS